MMNNKKPTAQYKRTIKHADKDYNVIISVYDSPIRKSEADSMYTRVSIMDGESEYGHFYLPQPTPKEGADGVFEAVKKDLTKFKYP